MLPERMEFLFLAKVSGGNPAACKFEGIEATRLKVNNDAFPEMVYVSL